MIRSGNPLVTYHDCCVHFNRKLETSKTICPHIIAGVMDERDLASWSATLSLGFNLISFQPMLCLNTWREESCIVGKTKA